MAMFYIFRLKMNLSACCSDFWSTEDLTVEPTDIAAISYGYSQMGIGSDEHTADIPKSLYTDLFQTETV